MKERPNNDDQQTVKGNNKENYSQGGGNGATKGGTGVMKA